MANKKIAIVGYGSVGQYVLDLITRMEDLKDCEIIIMSRSNPDKVIPRINTTIVASGIEGCFPKVRYIQNDLNDIDKTAEVLKKENPDIIGYTGRFIKGIKYGSFSYPNKLGYGAWIPLALPLIYKLMQAVKKADISCKVINTSFPDGVCPALQSVGLSPYTGAGNLSHLIPRITLAVANKFNVNPNSVDVKLVGSHYLNTYVSKEGSSKGSPYMMYYSSSESKDIYSKENDEEIFSHCNISMLSDHTRNLMVASDVAKIIRVLVTKKLTKMHLPGFFGYIGGYPVYFNGLTSKFDLPLGIELSNAMKINADNLRFDGIDSINDGIITFTDDVIDKMDKVFDIQYPKSINIDECETLAYSIEDKLRLYDVKQSQF